MRLYIIVYVTATKLNMSEYSWSREWEPTPVFSLGKSHEWRSLVSKSQIQLSD